jgi:hypothetical protein
MDLFLFYTHFFDTNSFESNVDSNGVLTREEKEELVLDLYFNQKKKYSTNLQQYKLMITFVVPYVVDKDY